MELEHLAEGIGLLVLLIGGILLHTLFFGTLTVLVFSGIVTLLDFEPLTRSHILGQYLGALLVTIHKTYRMIKES